MDQSPNLRLPYIMAAQAQKHVTHNEAIRTLDAVVQLSVLDKDLAAPPASPADGARYIVPAGATGAWSGAAGRIAAFQDGAWALLGPVKGWIAWVADENALYAFDGAAWSPVSTGSTGPASVNPTPLVGVNTTADTTNRLAVASPASIFTHIGAGHQQKINKASAGATASVLFQTGFSGRAEFGLTGSDDLRLKVSPDGSAWKDALVVDRASGSVSFPFTALGGGSNPNLLVNGDFQINQRAFAFGALASGTYGVDRWKASGTSTLGWDAATLTTTINAGGITQVIEPAMVGLASLASQAVTVSVEGLTNGNLTVVLGSQSGAITAGSGRRSVTLTLSAGDTGNLSLTVTPTSYPVWFSRVKAELGAVATPWQAPDRASELARCQRYFYRLGGTPSQMLLNAIITSTSLTVVIHRHPVVMRATPTLSVSGYSDMSFVGAISASPVSVIGLHGAYASTPDIAALIARPVTNFASSVLGYSVLIVNGATAQHLNWTAEL